jgi:transposase InsO family protein
VWRILCHHRLNTARLRYDLMVHRSAPAIERPPPRPLGQLDATYPGDLVQMDCFHVGSFKETRLGQSKARRGTIWQYTAIDVASSYLWAEVHSSVHNPDPTRTTALAYRVAKDLRSWGWEPKAISTDNGNEFRAQRFRDALSELGITHRFIRAGRPQSNGKVERVQGTLLEEFYKPVLSRYTEPSITGLRRDLEDYLSYYNWQRQHSGKWNRGRTPAEIIEPKEKLIP